LLYHWRLFFLPFSSLPSHVFALLKSSTLLPRSLPWFFSCQTARPPASLPTCRPTLPSNPPRWLQTPPVWSLHTPCSIFTSNPLRDWKPRPFLSPTPPFRPPKPARETSQQFRRSCQVSDIGFPIFFFSRPGISPDRSPHPPLSAPEGSFRTVTLLAHVRWPFCPPLPHKPVCAISPSRKREGALFLNFRTPYFPSHLLLVTRSLLDS